jgi:Carboxypeptidase regulatory-like domain
MWNILAPARRTLLVSSAFALCSLPMYGQTPDTGAIAGSVSDPKGALVPRAAVVIDSEETGEQRQLTTDVEGSFSVPFLTPGNYDLTVRATGFEPLTLKGVQVQITEVSRLKVQLTISGVKTQITVTTEPPLLQTENATLGRVIDQQTVVDLPLVNRNFTEILGLTAGTNTDVVDATQLGAGSQEIRANGARSGDNNFMLNGVDANSYSSNITKYPVSGGGTIFGSLGRNILRGPDQRVGDIAVLKTTPITERMNLVFRWEAFNVLNRPNFANPSNALRSQGHSV